MPNTVVEHPFIHVVAGIIRDPLNPKNVFLTRRKPGQHLENLWEFPGGKLEPGESRFHGLRRELMEETGISIVSALPFHSVLFKYPEKRILLDVWEVKNFCGTPHGNEEQEVCWQAVDRLTELEFPSADQSLLVALNLPPRFLIIPDFEDSHRQDMVMQLQQLLEHSSYPLILYRAHHRSDKQYAEEVKVLQSVIEKFSSNLVVTRPTLKGLLAKSLDDFEYKHFDPFILDQVDRYALGNDFGYSASCHTIGDLKRAEALGCRFATVSVIRSSLANAGRDAKGWYKLNSMIRHLEIPVYALGGVRRIDLVLARYSGAIGVAGVSDFWINGP